ncbi:hypothetical protein [Actinoalloteichus hymeniacidonis]|uniref:Uncharacterized protein n=1 Tax=Actinoalloteichus hymeniacidonis TaxID=340345 RepID=A0AAC9HLS9_9PSEU|nr:hypothetical protein [Actinoalloteichus hymeniacidonis]AOS61642.1 hypothetical protein TL08_04060 [Actinoalloteichus hymeniacidonis]MBB5910345.1 hypothetical protein [Actinoalloteichus hymeniacidonis]
MISIANNLAWSTLAFGVDDPGGQGEDFGKSSPVGLVLLILFFVAVGLLVRSMTRHLRRLPASFDPPADDASRDDAEPTDPRGDGAVAASPEVTVGAAGQSSGSSKGGSAEPS